MSITILAAVALWVSAGALTIVDAAPGAPRLAVLPPIAWLLILLAGGAAVARVRPREPIPVVLVASAIVLLPWLPGPLPLAAFIWAGPLRLWVWAAIAAALAVPAVWRAAPQAVRRLAGDSRRAPVAAGALALGAYLAGAWLVRPVLPAGDEPHYLVITQSLLKDGDLKIENNHRQGDYREYFRLTLQPDYLRRGIDDEIYSIHAPGLPAIVAPAYALFGHPGVMVLLAVFAAWGTALTWVAVWHVTGDKAASWFGWAATALSSPFFFHAFAVYPDAPGGALVMVGVLGLLAGPTLPLTRLFATGAALALLPWLHTRFSILALFLTLLVLGRNLGSRSFVTRAATLLAPPAASALAWLGFFYVFYGTPNPAAPYGGLTQSAVGNLPRGITGLLFDQQFGLIPNAPVYLCAAAGAVPLLRRAPRLAVELIAVIAPYGLLAASYHMWWGGLSAPARFLVPVLLPMAIPAGVWWTTARGGAVRIAALAALVVSGFVTLTLALAEEGELLFNSRDAASKLLLWLSPVVDVTTGLPSSFRSGPAGILMQTGVWLASLAAAIWIARAVERRRASTASVAAGFMLAAGSAGMLAITVVWRLNAAQPVTPTTGGAALLHRYDPDRDQIAVGYAPLRRLALADVPPAITLASASPALVREGEPLLLLRQPPAAVYEIEATFGAPAAGRLTTTIDRAFGPAWSWDLTGASGTWRGEVPLAAPTALQVDGDAAARQAIDRILIRARRVPGSRERVSTASPLHIVRYGSHVVYLMSGHAYVEREGIWIGGGSEAEFLIAPDSPTPVRVFVRNAPVENRVTLESGTWRQELALRPGEERLVDMPGSPDRNGVLLRVASLAGFRPADVDPASRDQRLLGSWIETR